MKIEIIPCLKDNYSYLIIDEENKNACVVDPSEAKPIIKYLEKNNIELKYILNTHHHYDHVGGNIELKKKYDAKVIGYIDDLNRIPGIDVKLKDEEIWKENNFEAKIIHIPGHTLGHVCFHFYKDKNLFTGDTVFSLGCGRIFEGTYEQMCKSINKIKNLPSDTKVYCGHEYTKKNYEFCKKIEPKKVFLDKKINKLRMKISNNLPTIPTTIKEELKCNVFFRCDSKEVKSSLNMKNDSPIEIFSKLRDLKDNF